MLSTNILENFGEKRQTVEIVALYLGANIYQDANGKYIHTLALFPSRRDPQGGVVRLKLDSPLNLELNTVYHLTAESKFDKAGSNYGVYAFHLDNIQSINVISQYMEKEVI